MSRRAAAAWIAGFVVLAVAGGLSDQLPGTGGDDGAATGPTGAVVARVTRVVDGDTIAVRVGGRDERVRYIGVDTPETVKPNTPVQCFGHEAGDFNKRFVAGRRVTLRFDRERRDRYGRLLAYVYRGDRMVNAELISLGLARRLTIAPNDAFAGRFRRLEARARRAGRGLWSGCSR